MSAIPLGRTEIVTLPDPKDPADKQRYRMDWSAFLAPLADTVTTSTWSANGMTLSNPAIDPDGLGATTWISGGEAGHIYTVSNRIDTTDGRTVERSFKLEVQER
jgi:hypothetical protein